MTANNWDPKKVAISKGMVYLHFGFPIGTGVDITSVIATPLGRAHLAGSLNQIGMNWVPQSGGGAYSWVILTPDDVAGKTPAGELMRLCYAHLHDSAALTGIFERMIDSHEIFGPATAHDAVSDGLLPSSKEGRL